MKNLEFSIPCFSIPNSLEKQREIIIIPEANQLMFSVVLLTLFLLGSGLASSGLSQEQLDTLEKLSGDHQLIHHLDPASYSHLLMGTSKLAFIVMET